MNALERFWIARAVDRDELGTRVIPPDPEWRLPQDDPETDAIQARMDALKNGLVADGTCKVNTLGAGLHVAHPVYTGTCAYCGLRLTHEGR
jgi:hypothetical protein